MKSKETEISKIERTHIMVAGLVQGVGYRKFVVFHALRLDLAGFCKNLPSGEVEVEAEGHPENIKVLIQHLHAGPARGRVEKVTVSSSLQPLFEQGFTIRY
jgi:acylphosphatase